MGDKAELVQVMILGRSIQFKPFNDTQVVMIHRMRQLLAGATAQLPARSNRDDPWSDEEKQALESSLDTTARFLDMLGFMVVNDADRDWLTMQMLAGNLDLAAIGTFVPDLVASDAKETKAPAKKAVRARR